MTSYKKFLIDLNTNIKYEHIAANKICILNKTTIKHTCNDFSYDFMTNENISYEVKNDKMSKNNR